MRGAASPEFALASAVAASIFAGQGKAADLASFATVSIANIQDMSNG